MSAIEPIRIFHGDDDAAAIKRHKDIEAVLEPHGEQAVRAMMGHGFPTQWNTIITAWLRGDRVKDAPAPPPPPPAPGED